MRKFCSVPDGTIQDADLAVEAAKNAFDSWSKSPIQERIRILHELSSHSKKGQRRRPRSLPEVGTPIEYSRIAMVGTPRVVSKSYEVLDSYKWEGGSKFNNCQRANRGMCFSKTPITSNHWKGGSAIAAGCTMILKPSREAPINAFILADILHEIGLPDGVFNLVEVEDRQ